MLTKNFMRAGLICLLAGLCGIGCSSGTGKGFCQRTVGGLSLLPVLEKSGMRTPLANACIEASPTSAYPLFIVQPTDQLAMAEQNRAENGSHIILRVNDVLHLASILTDTDDGRSGGVVQWALVICDVVSPATVLPLPKRVSFYYAYCSFHGQLVGDYVVPVPGLCIRTTATLDGGIWNLARTVHLVDPTSRAGSTRTMRSLGAWKERGGSGRMGVSGKAILENIEEEAPRVGHPVVRYVLGNELILVWTAGLRAITGMEFSPLSETAIILRCWRLSDGREMACEIDPVTAAISIDEKNPM